MDGSSNTSAMENLQRMVEHDYVLCERLNQMTADTQLMIRVLAHTMDHYDLVQRLVTYRDYALGKAHELSLVTPSEHIRDFFTHQDKNVRLAIFRRMAGQSMMTNRTCLGRLKKYEQFWGQYGPWITDLSLLSNDEKYAAVELYVTPVNTLRKLLPALSTSMIRRRNAIMEVNQLQPAYLDQLTRLSMVIDQELLPKQSSKKISP